MTPTTARAWCAFAFSTLTAASVAQQPTPSPGATTTPADAAAATAERWDVSAPHGPTETVELDLTEGTWMNLDVSPDGTTIVFDLLGDIWSLPIDGGDATPLLTGPAFTVQPRFSPDGRWIAFTSDAGGGDNLWVMRADGSAPRAITNESFRLLNNPAWTPDGRYLAARKHFTATRSLGAGEIWMYPVDLDADLADGANGRADFPPPVSGGTQLTKKRDDQHDAGEPEISADGRYLYYSVDVSPGSTFEYNRDPNGTIYAIRRVDLDTGETITLLGEPGGSARPELSPDGRHLAFVRRIRARTALCVVEIATGAQRVVWDGLGKDGQETWCVFGVHPNFAWTPDSASIVVQAHGKLRRVRVDGTGGAAVVTEIPFRARGTHAIRNALRTPQDIGSSEQDVRVIRWPQVLPDGSAVVFQALGRLWIRRGDETPRRLTDSNDFEFHPALSPDGTTLAYTTWHDTKGGRVMTLDVATGERRAVVNLPGHYAWPSFDAKGKRLLYERIGSTSTRGTDFTINPGNYVLDLDTGRTRFVTRVGSRPRFSPTEDRLLVIDREGDDTALVSLTMLGYDRRVVATSRRAIDIVLSPDGRHVAWEELFHVWLADLPRAGTTVQLAADRKDLTVRKLTRDGGEFVAFSADGQRVWHNLAATLTENVVADAFAHRGTGQPPHTTRDLSFRVPTDAPSTDVVLDGARIVTMRGDEILADGSIWIRGNRIRAVGPRSTLEVDATTQRIDVTGKTILPGFFDAHAHMQAGAHGMFPQSNWPYLANLAFGVTTTHDPSNDTKLVFAQAELERAGIVLAPRLFSTGTILYGAEAPFKAVIESLDDARSHLRRMQAFGAFSVKSYNQPRRDQRQQVIAAADELGMLVVPEGGSMFFHNLTMILDGHTTLEHALPVAPLYEDVLGLFAKSRTAYNPTLVVGYGGLWGENYWYEHSDVWANERLLRFTPRALVDERSRRRPKVPPEELHHVELARGAAELARRGVPVSVSAHGQMQGICTHWDLWMFEQGGLSRHEALKTATIHPARAFGLDRHLGSLEPGKLADLLVLDGDPLEDLRRSTDIALVMKNGRLYDARTLAQVLPDAGPPPELPAIGLLGVNAGCACCADLVR